MENNKKEIPKELNLKMLKMAQDGNMFGMTFFAEINKIPANILLNHIVENDHTIKIEAIPFGNHSLICVTYENEQENIFFSASLSSTQCGYGVSKLKDVKERNSHKVWEDIKKLDNKPKEDYKKKYIIQK